MISLLKLAALLAIVASVVAASVGFTRYSDATDAHVMTLTDLLTESRSEVAKLNDVIGQQQEVIATIAAARKLSLRQLGYFECTAYESGPTSCGKYADGLTSTMVPVGLGIAAADTRILPYGSIIYIPDLGRYFLVMDIGGHIKGMRLDLYVESVSKARKLGRRKNKVYILRRA